MGIGLSIGGLDSSANDWKETHMTKIKVNTKWKDSFIIIVFRGQKTVFFTAKIRQIVEILGDIFIKNKTIIFE
jgi:hypothetical protein